MFLEDVLVLAYKGDCLKGGVELELLRIEHIIQKLVTLNSPMLCAYGLYCIWSFIVHHSVLS